MPKLLITIDGPAGAGKTTVSRELAERLAYRYVDTGALYRGVAHTARVRGVAPEDDAALGRMLAGLRIEFARGRAGPRILVDGEDITERLRSPEVSMLASTVSARPVVRAFLLKVQQELGREKAVVFEGRDMGTVVFPEADLKFFLSASEATRAQRRYAELRTRGGADLEEVARDLHRRDAQDRTRALAPLTPAADAVCIDSSELTVAQVVEQMLRHVNAKLAARPGSP
ncbi:MAG: (d)CMP kinase [Desulfobacterales bacterium]|jgi:cytidylate kinase|nr:(d)CMP kinase [Desulfobacterales bacterium]